VSITCDSVYNLHTHDVCRLGQPVRIGTVMPLTESRNVEFKKGGALYSQRNMKEVTQFTCNVHHFTSLLQQICRYGSAFLNSGGGVIYFGVLDNGGLISLVHACILAQVLLKESLSMHIR